jgi:hypothetical protein
MSLAMKIVVIMCLFLVNNCLSLLFFSPCRIIGEHLWFVPNGVQFQGKCYECLNEYYNGDAIHFLNHFNNKEATCYYCESSYQYTLSENRCCYENHCTDPFIIDGKYVKGIPSCLPGSWFTEETCTLGGLRAYIEEDYW